MGDSEQDESQKTEDPTPKKLEESRKKGQVALSKEMNNWLMLASGTLVVIFVGPGVMTKLRVLLRGYLMHADSMSIAPGNMRQLLGDSFSEVFSIMTLPITLLVIVAFLAPFIQVGAIFAPEVIKPSLEKISPAKGFTRLFSKRSLAEFVKGLCKLGIITGIGVMLLSPFYSSVDRMVGLAIPDTLAEIKFMLIRMMTGILIVLLLMAVADLLYQRWEHYKKMRMSRQELKDEYKQSEGDPHVKSRLRQLRHERARARMMQNVPEADVVITNPTHFAIALKYKQGEMVAPVCIAKGQDNIALKIREIAEEHEIEIYENPPLARSLYEVVEVDQEIPQEMYKAVAEVISYVFKKQGKLH